MTAGRPLFITATREGEGKTVLTLGLTKALQKYFSNIGFIRPLGLATHHGRYKVDSDTLLVSQACNIHANLEDMNPVTIGPGFSRNLVSKEAQQKALGKIKEAYEHMAQDRDLVIIEGTGHAATGFVYGLGNAQIARLLNAKVLLVSSGGVGQPVDELKLNRTFFEAYRVPVIGAVINQVRERELLDVKTVTKKILEQNGIRLVGMIPYLESLQMLYFNQILEEFKGELISGESNLRLRLDCIKIGAMTPRHALNLLDGNMLIITPGDREDLILTAYAIENMRPTFHLAGLVLSGGIFPHKSVIEILRKKGTPAMVAKEDTHTIARRISRLSSKIPPWDKEKIELIFSEVERAVDFDYILNQLKSPSEEE